MKVLVVVGTKGPFPRLIEAVAQWAAAREGVEVWVQHAGGTLPAGIEGVAFAPHAEIVAAMASADVVVCHAGGGAVRDALRLGHVPVVVPRLARHGEHINDHQLELVEALGDRIAGCAAVEDAAALDAAMARALAGRTAGGELPGEALRADLKRALATAKPAGRARWVYKALDVATWPLRGLLRKD